MTNRPRNFTSELNRQRALEVLAMYEAGGTVRELADRLGRDEGWVGARIRYARRVRSETVKEATE